MLTLPFDLARVAHAQSVKAGLIKDSLISSARYAQALGSSEKLMLGPWARTR